MLGSPIKKDGKKVNINITRLTEQRLLDSKLLRPKPSSWGKVLWVSALLGILAGGIAIGYLYYAKTPLTENFTPEIIITEGEKVQPPPAPASEPPAPPPVAAQRQIEVLPTPTGYLNVREAPGTSSKKIAEVKPGETYELISENPEKTWYQIKITETLSGWVIKDYAKVKE